MNTATLKLDTLTCPSCMLKIEAAARNVPESTRYCARLVCEQQSDVRFDEIHRCTNCCTRIEKVGYPVLSTRTAAQR